MLKINKIKIDITTANGIYGINESFGDRLNFLASEHNTCGKSSILNAIYYCLGLEQIIGGIGEKVLTSVFKTTIEDGDKIWSVLDSAVYLEISNGEEVITLYRTAIMQGRDSKMITIFYSDLSRISCPDTLSVDMYVHLPHSATNEKGFHAFLEKFLFLELPYVASSDGAQRKLYLQLIFSGLFIEQKHGWAALFSGMPILGVRESKKRVVEFLLNLDTLENDKLRDKLKISEAEITNRWKNHINELITTTNRENCSLVNLPINPRIVKDFEWSRIAIIKNNSTVLESFQLLQDQLEKIKKLKPKIVDNFDSLQIELHETETVVSEIEKKIATLSTQLQREDGSIAVLIKNLETIENDLRNNKDAARLRKLGSNIDCASFEDICPLCRQRIDDSLLLLPDNIPVMSIDENIRHLDAQKEMLSFAYSSHKEQKELLKKERDNLQSRLFTLRRLAQSIRSDLYTTDEDCSETVVYKKINLEKEMDSLSSLQVLLETKIDELKGLSSEWLDLLEAKKKLPKERMSETDQKKIKAFRNQFIKNLNLYGYKSIPSLDAITISEETYLPLFEGFDIKFDSSASDNIRVIWAFTMALMQVSLQFGGNHPAILMFDEPDQQSTVITDMDAFFRDIINTSTHSQIIIGITLKDSDTKSVINRLDEDTYKVINVPYKAMKLLH